MAKYGKSYGTKEEFEFRASLFKNTLASLAEISSQNEDHTFTVGVNKFADWTTSEYKKLLSYKPSERMLREAAPFKRLSSGVPDSIDWRTLGAVNPV